MAQYTGDWDDSLPQPGDDGSAWPLDYNGNIERNSRAIPATVSLTLVDGTAYAIADGDVIASGANHASVIQSAIDFVSANANVSNANKVGNIVGGWVDGGMHTFSPDSTIRVKSHVGVRNLDLDGGGRDFGSEGILSLRPADPGQSDNILLDTVRANNSGGGSGINCDQTFAPILRACVASDNAEHGVDVSGAITATILGGGFYGNSISGIEITDNTYTHGNVNRVYWAELRENEFGVRVRKDSMPGDDTDLNLIESCNFDANADSGVYLDDGARSTVVRDSWFEGSERLAINGPNRSADLNRIVHNKLRQIDVDNGKRNEIEHNYASEYASLNINIYSGATETVLENNFYDEGALTDNGVRTIQNGASPNAGSPKAGEGAWSGYAALAHQHNVSVFDTTVSPWAEWKADGAGEWIRVGGGTTSSLRTTIGADQSIASGDFRTVQLDDVNSGVAYDTKDEFDTANHQFVVSEPGVYLLTASVMSVGSGNGGAPDGADLNVRLRVNGETLSQNRLIKEVSYQPVSVPANQTMLSAGDAVDVAYRSLDDDDTLLSGSGTYLTAHRLSN